MDSRGPGHPLRKLHVCPPGLWLALSIEHEIANIYELLVFQVPNLYIKKY